LAPCNSIETGNIPLPWETDGCQMTTESGKGFLRSIFNGVWQVAKTGRYFVSLSMKNVFVSQSGKVRSTEPKSVIKEMLSTAPIM
jgi:hypothetical protein